MVSAATLTGSTKQSMCISTCKEYLVPYSQAGRNEYVFEVVYEACRYRELRRLKRNWSVLQGQPTESLHSHCLI